MRRRLNNLSFQRLIKRDYSENMKNAFKKRDELSIEPDLFRI